MWSQKETHRRFEINRYEVGIDGLEKGLPATWGSQK